MAGWGSDQLIVLGERETRSQGEGADVIRSQQRKTLTEHDGPDTSANLTVGDSEQGESIARLAAEASIHEEPGAGKPHAGICAGAVR